MNRWSMPIIVGVMLLANICTAANIFYDNAGDVTLSSSVDGIVYVDYYERYADSPYLTPTNLNITTGVSISEQLRPSGSSSVSISGDSWFGRLNMEGDSSLTMYGSTKAKSDIGVWAHSNVNITENASVTGKIQVGHDASIKIYVTDFAVDGVVLTEDVRLSDYGVQTDLPNNPYTGTISGTMENGLTFCNYFQIFNSGSYATGDWTGTADIYVHIVPEPASLLLLGLGGLLLRRKA